MGQNKNTGLTFAGPKQTLSSLGRTRWNARNPKNNCKGNTNTPDNHLSEMKGGRGVGSSSLPHKTMLGFNPMGVVNATHSYASTILLGGTISEIAPIAPFPFEHFFMELAKAREEESSIRANLELPMVVPVRTDNQPPSQQPRSFSLGKSENIDTDLYDLLPLPSFRERRGHLSCAKSRHNGIIQFPRKRQRVGKHSRHLAGSTAAKMKHNNKAVKNATQKELLERKKVSLMKLQSQLDSRKQQQQQQIKLQANDYDYITPDTNAMHSMDSGSIISIRSEDERWFKVPPVRSGQSDMKKKLLSTGFHPVNGGNFNVGNRISRETVREVMKKIQNQTATAKVIPKKEILETPPSVMTSTGVSKESKIKNEGAEGGINVQSSSNHGSADEVMRVRDQTFMKAISKERMYKVPSAATAALSNEHKADDNEKTCEIINGTVNNNAHHHDPAGDGMKINGKIAVVSTPKPDTESAPTTTNVPVAPSVINHIHVESPTSTQTTIPSEVLSLLREMAKHQHTLAEAARRQMEVLEQPAPANKKSDAELLGGTEDELPPPPPPSIPMPASSAPIVVMQQPPSSSHPVTTSSHKENSNNRSLSRLNTALVSAVLAVSNRLDNMDTKVMERVIEAERMAQEALKGSKDSIKRLNKATLESRFEKVGTVAFVACVHVVIVSHD